MMEIYLKMPKLIQNLAITIKGLHNRRIRFGTVYKEHFEFLTRYENLPYEEKKEYQHQQLLKLVAHSRENSRFYSNRIENLDFNNFDTSMILSHIDKLSKSDLRLHLKDIQNTRDIASYTGGTTGVPLKVFFTLNDFQKRMATLDYFKYRTSGFVNNKMSRASFTGKEIISRKIDYIRHPYRINFFSKQYLFSSYHLNNENIKNYIDSLNKLKPKTIDGFYSAILDIAIFINANRIKLDFVPLAIYPTSETLTLEGVNEIEKAFGCQVFNQYASSEGAPFIVQCKEGTLHLLSSTGIFEIDSRGEMIVTSFTTYGTPLIRYEIGDKVVGYKTNQKCKCGIVGDTVEKIAGRSTNFILDGKGNKLTEANVANFFKEIHYPILKGQIVEGKEKEYTLKVVLHDEKLWGGHQVLEKAKQFLRSENVKLEIVKDIPVERSGKFMILKRNNQ